MSGISNEQIYGVLLNLKGDLGSIKSTLESHREAFEKHLTDDVAVKQDVTAIRSRLDKQSGAAKVWNLIATTIAAVLSSIVTYFITQHK